MVPGAQALDNGFCAIIGGVMRRIGLVALVVLGFAGAAAGGTLRVTEPASHARLRGGAVASLEWTAEQLPAGAEEWEAFLSVDGGRYYAFRITPHLDLDRRVTWVVPNVNTDDARVMIRVGDERRETTFESPDSFSIVRDPHAAMAEPAMVPMHGEEAGSDGDAEAARDGDPDVVAWAHGDRKGTRVTLQYAGLPAPQQAWRSPEGLREAPELVEPEGQRATPVSTEAVRVAAPARQVAAAHQEGLPPADLLLICRRWNV
jgi:hypothetical protein